MANSVGHETAGRQGEDEYRLETGATERTTGYQEDAAVKTHPTRLRQTNDIPDFTRGRWKNRVPLGIVEA